MKKNRSRKSRGTVPLKGLQIQAIYITNGKGQGDRGRGVVSFKPLSPPVLLQLAPQFTCIMTTYALVSSSYFSMVGFSR